MSSEKTVPKDGDMMVLEDGVTVEVFYKGKWVNSEPPMTTGSIASYYRPAPFGTYPYEVK